LIQELNRANRSGSFTATEKRTRPGYGFTGYGLIGLIAVSFQKETENSLISSILSGRYFVVCCGFLSPQVVEVNCYLGHVKKCNVMF